MLQRFHQGNKPEQKDGHDLPMVNQHVIFTYLFKSMEIRILSFVLPFMWRCVPKPNYFLHRIRDPMPFVMKMPDYPGTLIETPMFIRMQYGVPAKNPRNLMR
jgi:hypothetical protein